MPFLRVLRDKRGYETTYLMHWFREGTRPRSRVLYVFRTPGNVHVGRSPLDREALVEIEERYPDITFDWDAVRQHQEVIEPAPDYRRRRPKRDEAPAPAPVAPAPVVAVDATPKPASPPIPSALEGHSPDEQMAFLNRWYPVIRERVAQRMTDPARREALAALAERLDPAGWTDADLIAAGLPQAAEALERLSRVLTRRRRRTRKRSPIQGTAADTIGATGPADSAPASASAETLSADDPSTDDDSTEDDSLDTPEP